MRKHIHPAFRFEFEPEAVPTRATEFGKGGAPVRPSTMPVSAAARKRTPIVSGVLDYFPDALIAVAQVSHTGNEQHNPGQPLHWARGKSTDQADTAVRHLMERGRRDSDGLRHTAKAAWRILALLQEEIEAELGITPGTPLPAIDVPLTPEEESDLA